MSIILSEKHGVNPSVITCPICHKDIGIALLGRLKGDVEAPRTIEGNELCDDCKKKYVTVIEAEQGKRKPKPTGRRCFVPKEAFEEQYENNIVFMTVENFTKTFIKR